MKITFSTALSAWRRCSPAPPMRAIRRSPTRRMRMQADKDGDGRVSRAEATSSGAERSGEWFDKLDLNKDGYLTQEEMKQARDTRTPGTAT